MPPQPLRVLIIDDHAPFRAATRELLERRGFAVVAEADGAQAGRVAVQAVAPDAVVLDVNLPDGNGIALADELSGSLRVLLTSSEEAATGTTPFVPKTELLLVDLAAYLG